MPIFTAIGIAAFGAGTFLAGATAFVLKVAASVGLSYLARALAGKPDQPPSQGLAGVQGTLQADGDVPRSFMVGYGITAGSLVYANTWGQSGKTPNSYFTQVIALSDIPIQGIAEVWVNGELQTLRMDEGTQLGYPVTGYRQQGKDYLWIKFYDGTQTVADPFLVASVASAGRPYDNNRVGYGIAYAIVTARANAKLFSGFPQVKFALIGAKLYDISKDSSAGGTGTQRWDDPSTWGGAGDYSPMVQIYNLLRGVSYEGDWLYGAQAIVESQLPASSWIASINTTKDEVDIAGGDTEPRYRSGGQIQVSNVVADTIEALLSTCHGRIADVGGIFKPLVGDPGSATFNITDGMILSTAEQRFSPFFGLSDTINGITAKYPEPTEGWNVKVAPPRYRADYETRDGNRRLLADVALDFCPYKRQVQRLMKSALEEAQRARGHTISLPPDAQVLEPNDVIEWDSERNGYNSKLFRVDGIIDKSNLDVIADVTEINPNDYNFDPDVDYTEPAMGPPGRSIPVSQLILDWAAEGISLTDATGKQRRPAIALSWDPDVDDVSAVQFEVRLKGGSEVVYRNRTDNVEDGGVIVSQGLLAASEYQVRGRYLSQTANRDTTWSDWIDVTTPDTRLTAKDLSDEIINAVKQATTEALSDRKTGEAFLASLIAASQSTSEMQRDLDRRELKRTVGESSASILEQLDVAVGPDSALAQRISEVVASVADINASVKARFLAGATPDGAIARYDLVLLAELVKAGLSLIAISTEGETSSQIWLEADQLLFGKAGITDSYQPLFQVDAVKRKMFIDGSLILSGSILASALRVIKLDAISADLGDISAGTIDLQSGNSRILITPQEFAVYKKV